MQEDREADTGQHASQNKMHKTNYLSDKEQSVDFVSNRLSVSASLSHRASRTVDSAHAYRM